MNEAAIPIQSIHNRAQRRFQAMVLIILCAGVVWRWLHGLYGQHGV